MPKHKFKSIKQKGGLKIHLDGGILVDKDGQEQRIPSTKPIHRGFGYKTFRILRLAKVNTTNMAKAFNVTFDTIKDWKAIDDEEQAAKRAKADAELDDLRNV
jgi:hypothetical protein